MEKLVVLDCPHPDLFSQGEGEWSVPDLENFDASALDKSRLKPVVFPDYLRPPNEFFHSEPARRQQLPLDNLRPAFLGDDGELY